MLVARRAPPGHGQQDTAGRDGQELNKPAPESRPRSERWRGQLDCAWRDAQSRAACADGAKRPLQCYAQSSLGKRQRHHMGVQVSVQEGESRELIDGSDFALGGRDDPCCIPIGPLRTKRQARPCTRTFQRPAKSDAASG